MQQQISKSNFKAHALEIMREIESSGNNAVITSHGKACLVIKPYKESKKSPFDILKGSVISYTDATQPIAEDEWELA